MYQRILREGLSVRKVEELAQSEKTEQKKPKDKETNPYVTLEKELSLALGTKVKVAKGKVVISYSNEEELSRIAEKLI